MNLGRILVVLLLVSSSCGDSGDTPRLTALTEAEVSDFSSECERERPAGDPTFPPESCADFVQTIADAIERSLTQEDIDTDVNCLITLMKSQFKNLDPDAKASDCLTER